MTNPEDILRRQGPMMSSDLATALSKKLGLKKNTASQKVSRDKSILKITGFFQSGQSFCYLDEHTEESDFFKVLMGHLYENGRKYWYCINAIRSNGGILSQQYLECYTNYPILPLKSHLPFRKVMKNFVENKVLIFSEDYYLIAPKLNQTTTTLSQYYTLESIKHDILNNFSNLTKNIGLISYNTGEFFAEFGKFRWAFKGVCPIHGLKVNNNLGYLLADIIFGHPIREKDIMFFIEKIRTVQSFKSVPGIIPFLIVDDIETAALKTLKAHGVVVGFIKELFGEKYANTLKELVIILNNAGASLKKNPEKYLDLIGELKKYNQGLANNIKGALFEFVIGHIHSSNGVSNIEFGREVFINGRHEIDVLAFDNQKVVFAECKATKALINLKQIEKWTQDKIPAFRQWASQQELWKNKKLEFEYWSVSGFEEEAELKLTQMSTSASTIKISFFTGKQARDRAITMKNKKLKEAIDNFFLKPSL